MATLATTDHSTLVPAGTWTVDPTHSGLGFEARHMMIAKVRGRFEEFTGSIASTAEGLSFEGLAEVASISTNEVQRDAHLRSADFFDGDAHPQVAFRSSAIEDVDGNAFTIVGDLTMRGVTRQVRLAARSLGAGIDPWGNERVAIEASGEVDRTEFGLTWNQALEAGGVLVGSKVKLLLEVSAVRQQG